MHASFDGFRQIPAVDKVLRKGFFKELLLKYPHKLVVREVQRYFEQLREAISKGEADAELVEARLSLVDAAIAARLRSFFEPSSKKVINASGVLLHTNIGRAPLASGAFDWAREAACSYSNLEYDLPLGRRSHRDCHVEARLTRLLGCEAATIVNNNAAAVFLILNSLASGRKVLVSRGELVEIGGSFRIPDIMRQSGARLVEVGTTNRTTISDYRDALDEEVAAILRVHPSNYQIVGFTKRPALRELVALAKEFGILLAKDAGSGYLFPIDHPALQEEPDVKSVLETGVDLVCFSGDKLLGGPQAGLVLGRGDLMARIRKNPLMRICRVDKVIGALMEWTLAQYENGRHLASLPVYRMLTLSKEQVEGRAETLGKRLTDLGFTIRIIEGLSLVGGGAAPCRTIPTSLLCITSPRHSAGQLERLLRESSIPVLARVEDEQVLLDLRTVIAGEEESIFAAFQEMAHQEPAKNQSTADSD